MKLTPSLSFILLATLLSACSGMPFWQQEKASLKGERIKLSTTKNDLVVDDKNLAPINIPAPKANDGWYKSSGITSSQVGNLYLEKPLEYKTRFRVAGSSDFALGATPVIAGNTIFVSSASGTIEAFDLTSGEQLWVNHHFGKLHGIGKFDFFAATYVNGGISFQNNIIYATGGLGEIVAIKADNGELIWKTRIGSPTRATPLPAGNIIITQTVDNKVFALDSATGKVLWHHSGIAEDLSVLTTYAPAVSGKNVIVQYSSGEIYALDSHTGEEMWSSDIASRINNISTEKHLSSVVTSPTVDGGLVLMFSNDGAIAALKENSGEIVWKKDIGINRQFWVSGNVIFTVTNDNKLVCLDKSSGKIKWISELTNSANADAKSEGKDIFYTSPVIADSQVMLVSSNGKLLFHNAKSGALESEQDVNPDVYLIPVVVKGNLFLLDDAGYITRYGK